jgi:hypothetical protein
VGDGAVCANATLDNARRLSADAAIRRLNVLVMGSCP